MIFISHSTSDDAFVDKLAQEFAIYGIETWVDHRDMPPGEKWVKQLESALHQSDLMLLVVSESSINSEYVEAEWHTFFDLKRPIIPVRVDNCDVPLFLRTFHHINFRDPANFKQSMEALLNVLPDFSGITVKSRVQPKQTGFLSMPTDDEIRNTPDDLSDLDALLDRTQEIIDEQGPTFQANSIQVILPTEDVILQYPAREGLLIGRSHKSLKQNPDINLQPYASSNMVSRQHAMLFIEEGLLYIEDCGSTNGTYVNNRRIEASRPHGVPNYAVIHISREMPIVIRYSL